MPAGKVHTGKAAGAQSSTDVLLKNTCPERKARINPVVEILPCSIIWFLTLPCFNTSIHEGQVLDQT